MKTVMIKSKLAEDKNFSTSSTFVALCVRSIVLNTIP